MHISQQLLKFIPLPLQVVALLGLPPHFCLTLFFSFLSIYKPFVMHMTLNLSFCPNLFIHTPYWPTSQKPNTTIQAPVSSSRIPFFLSWAGVFTPSFFFFFSLPHSLVLDLLLFSCPLQTLDERTPSVSCPQPVMPPSSSNLICISCNRVHQVFFDDFIKPVPLAVVYLGSW